jgi:hypothetical protein
VAVRSTLFVLIMLFAIVPARSPAAQAAMQPRAGFTVRVEVNAVASTVTRPSRLPATHWKTGAIIGAAVGVLFVNAMMVDEGSAVRRLGLSLVGGAAVAMPGALIGGLFPKRE